MFPKPLEKLKIYLKKLPGVGERTSERYALDFLDWDSAVLKQLGQLLGELKSLLRSCATCGALVEETCPYCQRESELLFVVATDKDLFAIEEGLRPKGQYHVLGGYVTPLEDNRVVDQSINKLLDRLAQGRVSEVVLALDATLKGDVTAHYLKEKLAAFSGLITRPALGMPMGLPMEGIDFGTLSQAISQRRKV